MNAPPLAPPAQEVHHQNDQGLELRIEVITTCRSLADRMANAPCLFPPSDGQQLHGLGG